MVNEVNTEPKKRADIPKTPVSKPTVGATGETGSWRTFSPKIDYERCNKCRICWLYCPEAVISIDDEGFPRIDMDYCKGCGICAQVCPPECIEMIREREEEAAK